jgi:hypothetical protein
VDWTGGYELVYANLWVEWRCVRRHDLVRSVESQVVDTMRVIWIVSWTDGQPVVCTPTL